MEWVLVSGYETAKWQPMEGGWGSTPPSFRYILWTLKEITRIHAVIVDVPLSPVVPCQLLPESDLNSVKAFE